LTVYRPYEVPFSVFGLVRATRKENCHCLWNWEANFVARLCQQVLSIHRFVFGETVGVVFFVGLHSGLDCNFVGASSFQQIEHRHGFDWDGDGTDFSKRNRTFHWVSGSKHKFWVCEAFTVIAFLFAFGLVLQEITILSSIVRTAG